MEPDKALRHIEKALEKAPNTPAFLDTYSTILLEAKDFQAATTASQRAIEGDPDNSSFKFNYLQVLIAASEYGEARRVIRDIDRKRLESSELKEFDRLEEILARWARKNQLSIIFTRQFLEKKIGN